MKQYLAATLSALAAMFVYGGWAAYANFEYGRDVWLVSATVQGVYAFISTLTVTVCAQWVYMKCGRGARGIVVGFGISFILMLSIPVGVHSLVGTPNIVQTILPGLIWGALYLLGYLALQEKAFRQSKDETL